MAQPMRILLILAAATLLATSAAAHSPRPSPDDLALASVHAAVARIGEPEPLYTKNADRVVPIASITKLMTALVVVESGEPLDEWLTVVPREKAPPANAYSRIRIDSRLTRRGLLRLALMSSENLAAHVLASHHPGGREAFVGAMNARAQSLGMTRTRFVGPSGLSAKNRSTARDVLRLVKAAYQHDVLRDLTTTGYHRARFRGPRYRLAYGNTNPLVHNTRWGVQLSKTGYLDEAGRCLAMVSVIQGEPVAMVFLDSFGSRTPLGDAGRVRRWLTTGDGGRIAGAAKAYEERRSARYSGEK